MVKLEFIDPSGTLEVTQAHAPRLSLLAGRKIGFVSNEQWQAFRTLPLLKDMFEADYPRIRMLPIDTFPQGAILIVTGNVFPGMPRSALGIDWLLSLVLIGGSRFALRILAEQSAAPRANGKGKHAIVIGAGDAGALVVRELQKSSQLNLIPVGYLDDDLAKQKHSIYGVKVIGVVNDLAAVIDLHHVDEVIIAIPSAPGRLVRMVNDVCRIKGITSRTMPGIYEIIGGRVSVSRLREALTGTWCFDRLISRFSICTLATWLAGLVARDYLYRCCLDGLQ